MKSPLICPVALVDDLAENRHVVVVKIIEALLFIREHTGRPFQEQRNEKNNEILTNGRRGIKERGNID